MVGILVFVSGLFVGVVVSVIVGVLVRGSLWEVLLVAVIESGTIEEGMGVRASCDLHEERRTKKIVIKMAVNLILKGWFIWTNGYKIIVL